MRKRQTQNGVIGKSRKARLLDFQNSEKIKKRK